MGIRTYALALQYTSMLRRAHVHSFGASRTAFAGVGRNARARLQAAWPFRHIVQGVPAKQTRAWVMCEAASGLSVRQGARAVPQDSHLQATKPGLHARPALQLVRTSSTKAKALNPNPDAAAGAHVCRAGHGVLDS